MPNRSQAPVSLEEILQRLIEQVATLQAEKERAANAILTLQGRVAALERANDPAPAPTYPSNRDVVLDP